jgi:tetratricopeptide (TPR) repeat protein
MANGKTLSLAPHGATAQTAPIRATMDQMPRVSQKFKLICARCGQQHSYDVGTVIHDPQTEGEPAARRFAFTSYFRCVSCGSPGPWEMADYGRLLALALRARAGLDHEGLILARWALFDGTSLQTPAMGEDYLRGRLEQDPQNAFLCTRLGNLLRGCHELERAVGWYEKAIALDAGDVEARYHLFSFAVQDFDVPAAISHALLFVRSLLEGRETGNDELTEGIAVHLVETLRSASPEFRAEFVGKPRDDAEPEARRLIRELLDQRGDEEEIITEFKDRLLGRESEDPTAAEPRADGPVLIVSHRDGPTETTDEDDACSTVLVPSLRDVVAAHGLDTAKLAVAFEADGRGHIRIGDRHSVVLSDGRLIAPWPVASLRELFRGDRQPPADMDHYPMEYCSHFFFIEKSLLTVCDAMGNRTDQEMEEIYSALRRRPDGRSLGPVHDFFWQVCALLLGKYALSAAEFAAIAGQLERSVRKWALRPVSRNYVEFLLSGLA